jgi:hypothetical protein
MTRLSLRTMALLVALSSLTLATPARAQEDGDTRQIRAVIGAYFRGHATANPDTMRAAFLPTAHVEGIRNGTFTSWTLDQYVANFRGDPAADEARRTRVIDVIDKSGTAAMARATLKHGPTTFTDYFVLLKVDGQWRIANKVYHAQRGRPRSPSHARGRVSRPGQRLRRRGMTPGESREPCAVPRGVKAPQPPARSAQVPLHVHGVSAEHVAEVDLDRQRGATGGRL